MKNSSIWLDGINRRVNNELNDDIDVDVLIIGGGITGVSILYNLIGSNLKVALVEKNRIGMGVTARTTGKLTFLQENIYSKIIRYKDRDSAKLYLESQIEAIKIVRDIVNKHKIDCDFEDVSSFLFASEDKDIKKIKKEKEILEGFNVNVEDSFTLPDNKIVKYGIKVRDTAVFHPLKYLIALKNICNKKFRIYENTKVIEINKYKDGYICKTNNNIIKAKYVVIASHYPYFLFHYLFPLKVHLEKSYICASKVKEDDYFSAINVGAPTLSLRYFNNGKDIYKLVLMGSHNLAFNNNDKSYFNELSNHNPKKINYMWSNKDIITPDYLPYIGFIDDNLLLATGYNTWGMTNGTIAGKVISDLILGNKNKYAELFDPKRCLNLGKIVNFPINLVSNVKSFVGSKFNKNKSWYSDRVYFTKKNGQDLAIYIDDANVKHIVYNKCPHLKCGLIFNEVEKTWDCPCHGSRFDIDGKCIEGPSNYDIGYK